MNKIDEKHLTQENLQAMQKCAEISDLAMRYLTYMERIYIYTYRQILDKYNVIWRNKTRNATSEEEFQEFIRSFDGVYHEN